MARAMLRIRSEADLAGPDGASRDEYYSRLLKLIPGEIAALYTWSLALFADSMTRLYVALAVCGVILVFVRAAATKHPVKGVQWLAVAISLVSFGIWAAVLGRPVNELFRYELRDAVYVMAAWTIVVPWIYKGDPE